MSIKNFLLGFGVMFYPPSIMNIPHMCNLFGEMHASYSYMAHVVHMGGKNFLYSTLAQQLSRLVESLMGRDPW